MPFVESPTLSRCRDDEGRLKVRVNDQASQNVVLAHLVLLRIDHLRQQLVEIDSARRLACLLEVQFVLQLLLEAHDHVNGISVHDLEDKVMGATCLVSQRDRATQNALRVQVSLIYDSFYVRPL